jgi:hypothetical protein
MSENFDKESRKGWFVPDVAPTDTQLAVGCLQRIATATEVMAQNHDRLVRERDNARADSDYWRKEAGRLSRRLSAAKGQITRLKRSLVPDAGQGVGNG